MLHKQHHILCNISYVVIAESMGKSLKYTTNYVKLTTNKWVHEVYVTHNNLVTVKCTYY